MIVCEDLALWKWNKCAKPVGVRGVGQGNVRQHHTTKIIRFQKISRDPMPLVTVQKNNQKGTLGCSK